MKYGKYREVAPRVSVRLPGGYLEDRIKKKFFDLWRRNQCGEDVVGESAGFEDYVLMIYRGLDFPEDPALFRGLGGSVKITREASHVPDFFESLNLNL